MPDLRRPLQPMQLFTDLSGRCKGFHPMTTQMVREQEGVELGTEPPATQTPSEACTPISSLLGRTCGSSVAPLPSTRRRRRIDNLLLRTLLLWTVRGGEEGRGSVMERQEEEEKGQDAIEMGEGYHGEWSVPGWGVGKDGIFLM